MAAPGPYIKCKIQVGKTVRIIHVSSDLMDGQMDIFQDVTLVRVSELFTDAYIAESKRRELEWFN